MLSHRWGLGNALHMGVKCWGNLLHQIGRHVIESAGVEAAHIDKHLQVSNRYLMC